MSITSNKQLISDFFVQYSSRVIEVSTNEYKISNKDLYEVLKNLRRFFPETVLIYICAIDYPGRDERFEIVYHFLSLQLNERIILKVLVKEHDAMPSISNIFINSTWYEREIWDMYGILFEGNSDMRRILTDYGFVGHPMRKDFPLTGYTELGYNKYEKRVKALRVELQQDFRNFDCMSGWNILYGDEKAGRDQER